MTNESALECMEESIEVDQSLQRCCFWFMRVEKSMFYRGKTRKVMKEN
jgi:hypothetical protein